MKQFFYLSVFCVLALGACTGSFKKGDKGLEYKIISSGSGKTIPYGNFIQIHVKQIYAGARDTVLSDSRDIMPHIQLFDSVTIIQAYYKIVRQLRKGDSLIIRQLTDTAYKGSPQGMPPFMKKGKYMYTTVKLLNIFETQQQADSAGMAERVVAKPRFFKKQMAEFEKQIDKSKDQLKIDDKLINDYLAKNNIKAQKTKWGTYFAISTEGVGDKIDYNSIVSINYTGRTLDSGKVVDSNVDPKFNHVAPIEVNMVEVGSVIPGWTDVLQQLKKGNKATVFIPSTLAYGVAGKEGIKTNENLVFDMEILDVITEEQKKTKDDAAQQKMMEAERLRADSIQKAKQKSSPKK